MTAITKGRGVNELMCASILRNIFNKEFNTVRPDFLKNPETNHNLELDCYNEELQIGLEYSGEQHYVYPHKFHKSPSSLINQVKRDELKRQLCREHNVYLVVVPYTVKYTDLKEYIIDALQPMIRCLIENGKLSKNDINLG